MSLAKVTARLQPRIPAPGRARPQPAVNPRAEVIAGRLGTEVDYLLEGGYLA